MPTVSGIVVATGNEASGRRTLSEVVDELSRTVNAADETVRAIAGDAFRAAVRTMNIKGMWPWEVMDEDITITANQRFSTVSSAVKKPLAMHYLDEAGGTPDEKIMYSPYHVFVEQYTLDISGQAHTYTLPNLFETGQIRWFPVPSANDNARFTYYRVTPAPRVEQEAIEVPDHALEAYMSVAWYEFIRRLPVGQRPFDMAEAREDARKSFKELAHHVTASGDRTREVNIYHG